MTNEDEVGRHGALLASILVGAAILRRGPGRQHLHPRTRCSRPQHLARPPLAAPAARGSHTHAEVPPTGYSPCRWTQVAARRSRRAAVACRNLLALAAPPRVSRLAAHARGLVVWGRVMPQLARLEPGPCLRIPRSTNRADTFSRSSLIARFAHLAAPARGTARGGSRWVRSDKEGGGTPTLSSGHQRTTGVALPFHFGVDVNCTISCSSAAGVTFFTFYSDN
jgi:hypothetical protein